MPSTLIDEIGRDRSPAPPLHLRIRIVFIAIGLFLWISSIAYSSPTEFWVSPNGNDASPGTQLEPFRTLERARDAVRDVNGRQDPGTDITVYLKDGTYRLVESLVLDWRDSGQNGGDVVYRSAQNSHPVISGSVSVQNWSLYDANLGIYKAHVGQVRSRQLYVNGQRAARAQTKPYPAAFLPSYSETAGASHNGGILFIPTEMNPGRWNDPAEWHNPQDIEAIICTQWKMMRVPLDFIIPYPQWTPDPQQPDLKTGLIVMQEPGWKNANVFYDSDSDKPGIWSFWQVTRFENAYEFLDEPGEWYLDEAEGSLYYIPREGEDIATAVVELPLLEALVDGRGEISKPVSRIRFEGLTFSYATWLAPSGCNGYVADQSGFYLVGNGHKPNIIGHDRNDERTPGNLRFRFAREIAFSGNIFEHMGAVALDLDTGSQNNTITSNLFEDISSAAIQLGGISIDDHHPEKQDQVTQDNVIWNNLIRETGQEYIDTAAIYVGFTRHTTISHNTIVDVPWSGIAIGWGWGLLDPGSFPGCPGAKSGMWGHYDTPTPNSDNKIVCNRFDSFLNELWDGGAIYTNGQLGTSMDDALLIKGNVATDKRTDAGSNIYYTDAGSRYIRLHGNVSYDNPVGVMDFGPPPKKADPLPYSAIPSAVNGVPYGSDRGGCRTYGDIEYIGNYWMSPCFFDICPFEYKGVSYPTRIASWLNLEIRGKADVPAKILRAAGVRHRPASIPADRWILPPLAIETINLFLPRADDENPCMQAPKDPRCQ